MCVNYKNILLVIVLQKQEKIVFIWRNYLKNVNKNIMLFKKNMLNMWIHMIT